MKNLFLLCFIGLLSLTGCQKNDPAANAAKLFEAQKKYEAKQGPVSGNSSKKALDAYKKEGLLPKNFTISDHHYFAGVWKKNQTDLVELANNLQAPIKISPEEARERYEEIPYPLFQKLCNNNTLAATEKADKIMREHPVGERDLVILKNTLMTITEALNLQAELTALTSKGSQATFETKDFTKIRENPEAFPQFKVTNDGDIQVNLEYPGQLRELGKFLEELPDSSKVKQQLLAAVTFGKEKSGPDIPQETKDKLLNTLPIMNAVIADLKSNAYTLDAKLDVLINIVKQPILPPADGFLKNNPPTTGQTTFKTDFGDISGTWAITPTTLQWNVTYTPSPTEAVVGRILYKTEDTYKPYRYDYVAKISVPIAENAFCQVTRLDTYSIAEGARSSQTPPTVEVRYETAEYEIFLSGTEENIDSILSSPPSSYIFFGPPKFAEELKKLKLELKTQLRS